MISYDENKNSKHSLEKKGINYLFSIKDLQPDDAGLYQVDVEETNVVTTELKGKTATVKQDCCHGSG